MSGDREAERAEVARFEAARRAVRGVASAFRTLRLYPLHHARTAEALQAARAALDAYTAGHGSLAVTATGQGLVFDFRTEPYADDVVGDLARAMRARAAPTVQFLRGVSSAELGEFVSALHLSPVQIQRAGGLGALLGAGGVRSVLIETVGGTLPRGADLLEPLLEAVSAGAADRITAYLRQAGGDEATMRELFRTFDRRIVTRPRQAQLDAWKAIGQSLAGLRTPWQAALCAMIVRSVGEPPAGSPASRWPPGLAASLVSQAGGTAQAQGRRVAEVLRTFHRTAPSTPLPVVEPPSPADLQEARTAVAAWDERRLRTQAVRRLGELLPVIGAAALTGALAQLEAAVVVMVQEGDPPGLLAAMNGLTGAAVSLTDARADAVRAMVQRMLSLGAGEVFERTLTRPPDPDHPFVQAMQVAPQETVRVLLELAGDDDRLQVRRRAVDLLAHLAAGRGDLLVPYALDPRWHVARNAVTVLGRIGGPEMMPVLRAAMSHPEGHVRREAMQVASQLGTSDAMEALAEVLLRPDGETQAAAAYWLGVLGRPAAAGVLVAVLEGSPISEQVDLKREVIRALGRLRAPESADALRKVASRAGGELRQEAAAALARLQEGPA